MSPGNIYDAMMKNVVRLAFVSVFVLVLSSSLRAQDFHAYEINGREGCVYYGNVIVRGADLLTFEDLGFGYAKDIYHVYRHGQILEYVDPDTFRVSAEFAAGDAGHGSGDSNDDFGFDRRSHDRDEGFHIRVQSGDGGTKVETSGYYKTDFEVFYGDRKIPQAHAMSFEILRDGYAKDSFNVYWRGNVVEGAVPSSFKVLRHGYAEDMFSTYYNGKVVK